MGISPDSLGPAPDCKEYSSFSTAINLQSSSELGGVCRELVVSDAGSGTKLLAVTTAAGENRTFLVYTGFQVRLQVTHVLTATTVTKLLVLR